MSGKRELDAAPRTPLQAVVLADSFRQCFRPISVERPKVLMPLVNVPMLDYTLEWLLSAGVEEVFVFCCAHAAQIEAHLRSARWTSQPGFALHTIVSTDCLSAGEALRLVDQRNVVRSDFVLVSGDTVSNMSLQPVLAAHRARRAVDKLSILTMVTKRVSAQHRTARLGEHALTLAMDPETSQLLHYEEGTGPSSAQAALSLDSSLFSEHRRIQVRTDLLDCHIDICAPEVLFLFTDNFDYQHLRRDFVAGTLLEHELGNKIFVHQLSGEYAARVHNLRTYDAVARDIVQRWAYPFVPDANWQPRDAGGAEAPSYSYGRRNVYTEAGVHVARTADVGADTVLGAGTSVGEYALVRKSIVGRNCTIGLRACVDGCHVMDGAVVGDHVRAHGAIICAGAVLHPGAVVDPGAIISFDVVVGKGFHVQRNVRLGLVRQPEPGAGGESDEELEYAAAGARREAQGATTRGGPAVGAARLDADDAAALRCARDGLPLPQRSPWDESQVGKGGAGFRWEPRQADASDEWRFSTAPVHPLLAAAELRAAEEGGSDEEGAGGSGRRRTAAAASASGSAAQDGEEEDEAEEVDEADLRELHFRREVAETFLRCVKDGFEQSNAVVELQGLKMAENRSFADLARYILTTLLGLTLPPPPDAAAENVCLYPSAPPSSKAALLAGLRPRLRTWAPLLRRFLKTEDDQVEMLLTFEEFAGEEAAFGSSGGAAFAAPGVFAATLHLLYDADVLSEEAALAWAAEKAGADEADKRFVRLAQPFFDWLANASSDESEGEEEEETGSEDSSD